MNFKYNENLLQYIWENQLFDHKNLKTTDNQRITILKIGFLNSNDGPDFCNASIKIGPIIFHGSIEIHTKESEWNRHGHHDNANYNTVILHVCYETNIRVYRKDGTLIPSLSLKNRIDHNTLDLYQNLMINKDFVPCSKLLEKIQILDKVQWMDRMVLERLESRYKNFEAIHVYFNEDWNQTYYCILLATFGMPKNKECFEAIAKNLPLKIIKKHQNNLVQIEALLLGVAGILEPESTESYFSLLKTEWYFLQKKYSIYPINDSIKYSKIRPMNAPHIRLAQFASLLYHSPQLLNVSQIPPKIEEIRNMFNFDLPEFWDTHYNATKKSHLKKKKLSNNFIHHILINAVAPFIFFYEREKMDRNGQIALNYLSAIPAEKNSIIQKWQSKGVYAKNALYTQGLLHLYKSYCSSKKCLRCNWGKKILAKNHEFN